MLDGIEALIALEKYGTVSEAAIRLRLTQSAVSKRIQALQLELKLNLIEPDGRRVRLTSEGYHFLNKARPLIIELNNLTLSSEKTNLSRFSLGLSDSIAGSFGPKVVTETLKSLKNLELDFHVHRSLMLLENISLGKYQLGICTFDENRKDLYSAHLIDEPLALIHAEFRNKPNKHLPLITIEENSATWKNAGNLLKRDYPQYFANNVIYVESFMAVYQMTKVGLGNGLIPLGMTQEFYLKKESFKKLKVTRTISLVTRKTIAQMDFFTPFYNELKNNIEYYFEK
jgi:DNA-binding transcriptional LysR family regulator